MSNKDGGVAEIVSYDSVNNKAWVVNGATGKLDIISLVNITSAVSDKMPARSLDIRALAKEAAPDFDYGDMTSVSVNSKLGLVAVALQDASYDKTGYVAILNTKGELLVMLPAGNQPDMVTFTPDGSMILTANEGEPREGIGNGITDPAGSVTIITLNKEDVKKSTSKTVGFNDFDSKRDELVKDGVILTKGAAPSVDLEPEYIACTNDKAYVALQEANAIAVLDLTTQKFTGVYSLGYKDLSLEKNAIDLVSDDAFVALERTGGIMTYDITDPSAVSYTNYINTRDFSENPENSVPDNADTALKSDIAPEGLYFISASESPSKTPILLTACEVSGTVAAYSVGEEPAPLEKLYNKVDDYKTDGTKELFYMSITKEDAATYSAYEVKVTLSNGATSRPKRISKCYDHFTYTNTDGVKVTVKSEENQYFIVFKVINIPAGQSVVDISITPVE